jgi:hypothetical protein
MEFCLPSGPEAWDDGAIVDMFYKAIGEHVRGRGGGGERSVKRRKEVHYNNDGGGDADRRTGGIPGPWVETETCDAGEEEETEAESKAFQGGFNSSAAAAAAARAHFSHAPLQDKVDEAYQAMIHSWFNCGAATGRYQTLLELQQQQNHQQHQQHQGSG